eukprot:1866220-Amphidinium_carterae.1
MSELKLLPPAAVLDLARPGSAGPSPCYPKSTACGAQPANTTSENGVNDAGLGVKFRLEKVL